MMLCSVASPCRCVQSSQALRWDRSGIHCPMTMQISYAACSRQAYAHLPAVAPCPTPRCARPPAQQSLAMLEPRRQRVRWRLLSPKEDGGQTPLQRPRFNKTNARFSGCLAVTLPDHSCSVPQRLGSTLGSIAPTHQARVGVELVRRAAAGGQHRAPGHAQDATEAPLGLHEVLFFVPVRDVYPHVITVGSTIRPIADAEEAASAVRIAPSARRP